MKRVYPEWLTRNVIGFSLASLLSDASHEVVPLLLPIIIAQMVGSDAPFYVGLISGAATVLASIVGLYAGILSDHYPKKPLILSGYFLAGSLTGLLAFCHRWESVALCVAGIWLGRGMVSAPRNALLAATTDTRYYGRVFGFRQAFDTLGSVIGPALVYFFSSWSPSSIFLLSLIPGCGAFAVTAAVVNDSSASSKSPQKSLSFRFSQFPITFYLLSGVFLLLGLANFNKTMLILRTEELLHASRSFGLALGSIPVLYLMRNGVQAGASYGIGALSDSWGRIIPLSVFGCLSLGVMSFLLALPSLSTPLIIAVFLLSGISAGTIMTLQKSLIADLLPEELRGAGYGITATVSALGSLLSSIAMGYIWSSLGSQSAFLTASFLSFVTLCSLLPLYRLIHSNR